MPLVAAFQMPGSVLVLAFLMPLVTLCVGIPDALFHRKAFRMPISLLKLAFLMLLAVGIPDAWVCSCWRAFAFRMQLRQVFIPELYTLVTLQVLQ